MLKVKIICGRKFDGQGVIYLFSIVLHYCGFCRVEVSGDQIRDQIQILSHGELVKLIDCTISDCSNSCWKEKAQRYLRTNFSHMTLN